MVYYPPQGVIPRGVREETASYIIFKVGTTYYAKNGETGEIEFSGTDAATVIQSAIDAIGSKGGKIFIKSGVYEISKPIKVNWDADQFISIQGEGEGYNRTILRLADGVNDHMFKVRQYSKGDHFEMFNVRLEGNRANQTAGSGIYLGGTYKTRLRNLHIADFKDYGIEAEAEGGRSCTEMTFANIFIIFNDVGGLKLHASDDNFLSNIHIGNVPVGLDLRGNWNWFVNCYIGGDVNAMKDADHAHPNFFANCQFVGGTTGHLIEVKPVNSFVGGLHLLGCMLGDKRTLPTANTYDALMLDASNYDITNVYMVGCRVHDATRRWGVNKTGVNKARMVVIVGNQFLDCETGEINRAALEEGEYVIGRNVRNVGGVIYPLDEKEFFALATRGTELISMGYTPCYRIDADGEFAEIGFQIPYDFVSLVEAKLVWVANVSLTNMSMDVVTNYRKAGEVYNQHTGSATITRTTTANYYYEDDISGALGALEAGDIVGVYVSRPTGGNTDARIVGVKIKYRTWAG